MLQGNKLTQLHFRNVLFFGIIFLSLIFSSCKKESAKSVKPAEGHRKKVAAKTAPGAEPIKEEAFVYASHDKRDPFVPLVDSKGRPVSVVEGGLQFKVSDMYLEGIIWDAVKPMAIINDEVVSPGDKIRGVTIIEIKKDKVILSYQNETFELKMD